MELNNCKQLWLLALVLLAATATNADAQNSMRRLRQNPLDATEFEFGSRGLKSEKEAKYLKTSKSDKLMKGYIRGSKSEKEAKYFKTSKTDKFTKEAKSAKASKTEEYGKYTKDGKSFKYAKVDKGEKVVKYAKEAKSENLRQGFFDSEDVMSMVTMSMSL